MNDDAIVALGVAVLSAAAALVLVELARAIREGEDGQIREVEWRLDTLPIGGRLSAGRTDNTLAGNAFQQGYAADRLGGRAGTIRELAAASRQIGGGETSVAEDVEQTLTGQGWKGHTLIRALMQHDAEAAGYSLCDDPACTVFGPHWHTT